MHCLGLETCSSFSWSAVEVPNIYGGFGEGEKMEELLIYRNYKCNE